MCINSWNRKNNLNARKNSSLSSLNFTEFVEFFVLTIRLFFEHCLCWGKDNSSNRTSIAKALCNIWKLFKVDTKVPKTTLLDIGSVEFEDIAYIFQVFLLLALKSFFADLEFKYVTWSLAYLESNRAPTMKLFSQRSSTLDVRLGSKYSSVM